MRMGSEKQIKQTLLLAQKQLIVGRLSGTQELLGFIIFGTPFYHPTCELLRRYIAHYFNTWLSSYITEVTARSPIFFMSLYRADMVGLTVSNSQIFQSYHPFFVKTTTTGENEWEKQ